MSNYVEKQFNEIFESMLNDSLENGLISHAEDFQSYIDNQEDISNYYVMDKAVIAKMFAQVYLDMTSVYESAKVDYAEGSDLDDIGEIVGVPRPLETCAEVEVTFTANSNDFEDEINIPEGVIISTIEGTIFYQTLESIYISNDNLSATVQCRSVEAGVGFKVRENTLTNIVSDMEYDLTCTNKKASSGGNDTYSDDEYRYLLKNWIKIHVKGSTEAYENYFANIDGVDGYKLIPNWDKTGTMKVIVDPGTSYQLNQIYSDLQDTITQSVEDIVMFPPVEKYIDIYARVNVDIDQVNPYSNVEKEDIKSRIIHAIKIFIDGGFTIDEDYYPGLSIGEDFIPHKLAVFLDDEIPELKNITFITPDDYVTILDEEIGVSEDIIIEMM